MKLLCQTAREKKEFIKSEACFEIMISEVRQAADQWLLEPLPVLRFTDFCRFEGDGNRVVYEEQYFQRRGRLNAYTLMYWLTDDAKYKEALEDVLSAVLEEYTWALPAHLPARNKKTEKSTFVSTAELAAHIMEDHCHLDLFAAETGFTLCEVLELVGDMLTGSLRDRICYEVKTRIIDSFLSLFTDNNWEHEKSNWAAVCASGVGHCFLYLGTETEISSAAPRLLAAMKSYLSGLPLDGACLEGSGYWTYGFGYFLYFAESWKEYTGGADDLLASEHAARIAKFPQRTILGIDRSLTFSDAPGERYGYELCLAHYIYRHFDGIEVPAWDNRLPFGADSCYRFAPFIRNFLWCDPKLLQNDLKESAKMTKPVSDLESTVFFDKAGWYINRAFPISFAVKGGSNDEPHNHNDIGHFVLVKGNEYMLHDLGAGEYVAAYFARETRYDFLVNSSRGHSVPVIDGCYQREGKSAQAEMTVNGRHNVTISMEKAYGLFKLQSLKRSFYITDSEVILKDSFVMKEEADSIVERFITCLKPVIKNGCVILKTEDCDEVLELILQCDEENWQIMIGEEAYKGHRAEERKAYFIDFSPKVQQKVCKEVNGSYQYDFTLHMK